MNFSIKGEYSVFFSITSTFVKSLERSSFYHGELCVLYA